MDSEVINFPRPPEKLEWASKISNFLFGRVRATGLRGTHYSFTSQLFWNGKSVSQISLAQSGNWNRKLRFTRTAHCEVDDFGPNRGDKQTDHTPRLAKVVIGLSRTGPVIVETEDAWPSWGNLNPETGASQL
ncbi:hypothetical protein C8F04DRAFT_1195122 [Mycena alexandri]|uniref:Uncharacterized protein n=1 Tax=Mycena alexandri TaxID=1745969 RepID=A0AAD6SA84_9AGAR|nr:hypothetical protein C8F04DRAFT_1195122 [Mycena alexandri]